MWRRQYDIGREDSYVDVVPSNAYGVYTKRRPPAIVEDLHALHCATSNMAGRHEVLPTVAVNGERSACHITDLDEEGPLDDIGGYHRLLSRNWRKSSGWASDALHSKVVFMTSVRKYWVNS